MNLNYLNEKLNASQKSGYAYYCLAQYYLLSKLSKQQKDVKAFNALKKASDLSNPMALYALVVFYAQGRGTSKNLSESYNCLKTATELMRTESIETLKQLKFEEKINLGCFGRSYTLQDIINCKMVFRFCFQDNNRYIVFPDNYRLQNECV